MAVNDYSGRPMRWPGDPSGRRGQVPRASRRADYVSELETNLSEEPQPAFAYSLLPMILVTNDLVLICLTITDSPYPTDWIPCRSGPGLTSNRLFIMGTPGSSFTYFSCISGTTSVPTGDPYVTALPPPSSGSTTSYNSRDGFLSSAVYALARYGYYTTEFIDGGGASFRLIAAHAEVNGAMLPLNRLYDGGGSGSYSNFWQGSVSDQLPDAGGTPFGFLINSDQNVTLSTDSSRSGTSGADPTTEGAVIPFTSFTFTVGLYLVNNSDPTNHIWELLGNVVNITGPYTTESDHFENVDDFDFSLNGFYPYPHAQLPTSWFLALGLHNIEYSLGLFPGTSPVAVDTMVSEFNLFFSTNDHRQFSNLGPLLVWNLPGYPDCKPA